MKQSRGAILIVSLLVIAILLMAGGVVFKMIISEGKIVKMTLYRKQAFYLAEAGLEKAKILLINNSDWFTDLPHSPSNDISWLINEADGHIESLGNGSFKIIKESGKNAVYSIGYVERYGKKLATSILVIDYQTNPFKVLKWSIL